MPHLLIIEDELRIRSLLIGALNERGHSVDSARDGMTGLAKALEHRPDLVLLDLGLPDVDGTDVLDMLRAVSTVPVIVTTARDDDQTVIRALDAGADDYLVKPFTAAQLAARVSAVLRRSGSATDKAEAVVVGGLRLDFRSREATLDERVLELSRKEFELLGYLAERAGEVVSKRELLAEVWRQPYGGPDKTVDVHVSWLRRKLGESAHSPRYLRSVRGVGIKLQVPEA